MRRSLRRAPAVQVVFRSSMMCAGDGYFPQCLIYLQSGTQRRGSLIQRAEAPAPTDGTTTALTIHQTMRTTLQNPQGPLNHPNKQNKEEQTAHHLYVLPAVRAEHLHRRLMPALYNLIHVNLAPAPQVLVTQMGRRESKEEVVWNWASCVASRASGILKTGATRKQDPSDAIELAQGNAEEHLERRRTRRRLVRLSSHQLIPYWRVTGQQRMRVCTTAPPQ